MKSYLFKVIIEPDENAYHAYCPALKGCHTWGYTQEEALKNIREAVEAYMMSLIKHGGEIIDYTGEQVRRATQNNQHPDTAGKFDRNLPMSVIR